MAAFLFLHLFCVYLHIYIYIYIYIKERERRECFAFFIGSFNPEERWCLEKFSHRLNLKTSVLLK